MSIELFVTITILSLAHADFAEQPDSAIIVSGTSLIPGDSRFSKSQQYKLTFDGDIHLMQWSVDAYYPEGWYGTYVWSICSNQTGATFSMRYDGNLVLEDAYGTLLWSHDQNKDGSTSTPYYAMVGDGGNLVEFTYSGIMIWNSSNPDTQNSGTSLAKLKYGDCLSVNWGLNVA